MRRTHTHTTPRQSTTKSDKLSDLGILVTDRWSAYTWYPTRWRQICWAHLLRDFEAMIERGGRAQEIGEGLRQQARQMCHAWHRVCDGTLPHAEFRVLMRSLRRQGARWLKAGQTCGVAKTEGVYWEVLNKPRQNILYTSAEIN